MPRRECRPVGWPVFAFGFFAAIIAAGVAGTCCPPPALTPDRVQGFKGTRHNRRPPRAPPPRCRRALPDRVDGSRFLAGAALLIRQARTSIACSRLRHREHPGDDRHDHGAAEWAEFRRSGTRTRVVGAGRDKGGFRVGVPLTGNSGLGRSQFPGTSGSSRSSTDRVTVPLRSITARTTSMSWAWPSRQGVRFATPTAPKRRGSPSSMRR